MKPHSQVINVKPGYGITRLTFMDKHIAEVRLDPINPRSDEKPIIFMPPIYGDDTLADKLRSAPIDSLTRISQTGFLHSVEYVREINEYLYFVFIDMSGNKTEQKYNIGPANTTDYSSTQCSGKNIIVHLDYIYNHGDIDLVAECKDISDAMIERHYADLSTNKESTINTDINQAKKETAEELNIILMVGLFIVIIFIIYLYTNDDSSTVELLLLNQIRENNAQQYNNGNSTVNN